MLLSWLIGAALAAEPPRLPYRVDNVCPFECCTFGGWRTEKPITLYAAPSLKAPVVAKVAAHAAVTAQTGTVIVSRYGVTRILRPLTIGMKPDGMTPLLSLKPGATLYTLFGAGEGQTRFWYQGQTYEEDIYANAGDDASAVIQSVSGARSIWWAKIRTKDGKTGWTDQTRDFSGSDSCG